jgi:hypothetical protein
MAPENSEYIVLNVKFVEVRLEKEVSSSMHEVSIWKK